MTVIAWIIGAVAAAMTIGWRDGPVSMTRFEQVIRVNLIGTVREMITAAARLMMPDPLDPDSAHRIVVNTASITAFEG